MQIERDTIREKLEAKGFKNESKDHEFYYLYCNGKKMSVFTKISHGSKYKDYGDSLIAKVHRQMSITKKEFLDFIECSLTKEKYIALLIERGKITPTP